MREMQKTPLDHWCCPNEHPEWRFGTAGSLLMRCPQCGTDHFRPPVPVLHFGEKQFCVQCGDVELKAVSTGSLGKGETTEADDAE